MFFVFFLEPQKNLKTFKNILIGLSGRANDGFLSFIFCEAKNKR
jgi:hypothetical protein